MNTKQLISSAILTTIPLFSVASISNDIAIDRYSFRDDASIYSSGNYGELHMDSPLNKSRDHDLIITRTNYRAKNNSPVKVSYYNNLPWWAFVFFV